MRILQIRFKNLNSLAGPWEIDLTHPAFTSGGIFAISGPTGAGKTTILDAVCLALYGRTPRLAKVSKSANEVMSRQTGDCFAEVTFETQAGRFRCHWSQHRARRKPDGELQNPRQEIANADTGEVLETKITAVAKRIEAATGMDFDRFTRSMLLAQGGFAAFLQAAPDDRAPILEQITGTEIYSRISIRVHEQRAEQRDALESLQAQLAGVRLLSDEEERQLQTSLAEKTGTDEELGKQVGQTDEAIRWLDRISGWEAELKQIEEQRQEWQTRQAAFVPQQERLHRATRALELAADYVSLTTLRGQQEADRKEHEMGALKLPGAEQAVTSAEQAKNAAHEQFEARRQEQEQTSSLLREVRKLDVEIREKAAPIQAAEELVTAQKGKLKQLKTDHETACQQLEDQRQELAEVQRQLDDSQADERLVQQLAKIQSQIDAVQDLHRQYQDKLKDGQEAEGDVATATERWTKLDHSLGLQKQSLNGSETELAQQQSRLAGLLEGRELADWRSLADSLRERKSALAKCVETVQAIAEARQALETLGRRETGLVAERSDLAGKLEQETARQASLEQEIGLLETQLTLLKRIESLEEARQQLRDGEPCPLCGAVEHPYAAGNIPIPEETRRQLDEARAALKKLNAAVAKLDKRQTAVLKDLEGIASDRERHARTIEASEDRIRQSHAVHGLEAADPELAEKLSRLHSETDTGLERAVKIVRNAEQLEAEIGKLRTAAGAAKERVTETERKVLQAAHEKQSAEQLSGRLKKDADELNSRQQTQLNLLRDDVATYGVGLLSLDELEQVQSQLTIRRDRWLARQGRKSKLLPDIAALDAHTRQQAGQMQKSGDEIEQQRTQVAILIQERDALMRQRRERFGDKDPDAEEKRLAEAVKGAEAAERAAEQQVHAARQILGQLQTKAGELERSMADREPVLKKAEAAFLVRLGSSGFAGEQDFQAARLSDEDRQDLARQARDLAERKTELDSKERDKKGQLETERKKQVTDQSREQLQQSLGALVKEQKELQQAIGAVREKLKHNEQQKEQQQERVQALEAQKLECSRWDRLHELIGSADGKKYRNFAQGLTFEMMVAHANRQLQRLTDRYLLVRDAAQPLELNVMDNYQAGEVRSTKNLSGGESFLVSLSLALGLSQMASRNVRVDSLFLDEGFGTLDEEALDAALGTLASLQQDGKLIGVISHVPALKERIGTHIQVTPRAAGRSTLSGPGCRGGGTASES